ncbi:MAG TPA: ABC transporter ATP-binding protein [Candidatus Eisenbacteria bacterium]
MSLAIRAGEAFGIIGPNGAGKTTLLGCLLGFLRPDAGRIRIDGKPVDDPSIRAVTGFLPERLIFDRWMTGREFLSFHHALARLPAATRRADVDTALLRIGLADAGRKRVAKYSRGMLQRLGMAQALIGAPRLIYLDEPASGLDPEGVLLFRGLLLELKQRGATIVLNSHHLDEVERVCDRVAFVRVGKVEAIETPSAGASLARVLRVRVAAGWAWDAGGRDRLSARATAAGARLLDAAPPDARFEVPDDAGAARLLAELVRAEVPVIEASPDGSRLERLFAGAKPGAPQ